MKGTVLVLLLALHALPTFAQTFEVHPEYTFERWTTREGLPANTVLEFADLRHKQILQAADGYLWLTTIEGLVRFDGYQFSVFSTTNTPGLRSNRLGGLIESPPGFLWMQDNQWNVSLLHDGRISPVGEGTMERAALQVYADGETVWIGTGNGLAQYRAGRFEPYH
ncbi:MAG TPA: hypothetical protein VKP65_24115, partial [Rhodothermales bacterium]|nr:hypothetical protein [Rhodothermales bacterium]